MSVVAIWTWSTANEDVDAVRAALDDLVEHCRTEHPLIRRLAWLSAPAKDSPVVEFRWLEEYESRETMAKDEYTEVCAALWEPVKSRAIEGTFGGKGFDEGGSFER
jgi:hypothetical protein